MGILIGALAVCEVAGAGDWLKFRGPEGAGGVQESALRRPVGEVEGGGHPSSVSRGGADGQCGWDVDLPATHQFNTMATATSLVAGDARYVTCGTGTEQAVADRLPVGSARKKATGCDLRPSGNATPIVADGEAILRGKSSLHAYGSK